MLNSNSYIVSDSGTADIFIAQTNSNGVVQWAKKAGGNDINMDIGNDIALDVSGNCYIVGNYRGTGNFDNIELTDSADNGIFGFLAKYDNSGSCVWVKKIEGLVYDVSGLALDKDSNPYLTGSFFGEAYFDSVSLISNGIDDIFVAKYSASGNCLWAKNAGGAGYDKGVDIKVDIIGNSYLTGNMRGSVAFDSVAIQCNGIEIFVAKYDYLGNIKWVEKAGSVNNYSDESWGIGIDNSGGIYVSGFFENTAQFGSNTLMSVGGIDVFLAKIMDKTTSISDLLPNENHSFYPNPFVLSAVIELPDEAHDMYFTLFNSIGIPLKTERVLNNPFILKRDNFPSGLYYYHFSLKGEPYLSGKVIMKEE